MNNDLKKSIDLLVEEIKKDILFFGFCGFITALMSIVKINCIWLRWIFQLFGIADLQKIGLKILFDFLPANSFGLIFTIYVLLGTIVNCLPKRTSSDSLKDIVDHTGYRLNQIGSSIVSFVLGYGLFILCCAVCRQEPELLKLFSITILFSAFISGSVIIASLLARKKPLDKLFFAFVVILPFIFLLIKQLSAK
ncbi:hypothetical protein GCAAIG_11525 [Candidatus Electronema halotolerans]